MATRNYDRLSIEEFGKHLLESGDLDPIYIGLSHSGLPTAQLKRWLLAYWCLYHAGAASWLSEAEGSTFWSGLHAAATNTLPGPHGGRWPRGHERRHFRGAAAVKAVESYALRHPTPEGMVDYMTLTDLGGLGRSFRELSTRTQEHQLFGPWISFKVGDMAERVLGLEVDFSQAEVFMFADPTKAALMLWTLKAGLPPNAKPKDEAKAIRDVVGYLTDYFGDYRAPPRRDRSVGLQEVETILCKWKSHLNGHYPKFNDTVEIHAGLKEWSSTCETVGRFQRAMPGLPT
jgi:hypothetical protein